MIRCVMYSRQLDSMHIRRIILRARACVCVIKNKCYLCFTEPGTNKEIKCCEGGQEAAILQ